MHLSPIILTTSAAAPESVQAIFNTSTDQFVCPSAPPNGAYCTGPSLRSNIIIRCTGTKGVAGNCNDNSLAGVPPLGVKGFALCYKSSLTAGGAACSYGGTVHPDHGPSFPVPSPSNGNNNNNNSASITSDTAPWTAARNNVSGVSMTARTASSISTSTSSSSLSPAPAFAAAYTALAALPSARYPIPSAAALGLMLLF